MSDPTTKPTALEAAYAAVHGPRQEAYGHPIHDFTRTGRIWGAILADWAAATQGREPVPPELVGLCMAGVKISRECNAHQDDNLIDLAGYAETVSMVVDAQTALPANVVEFPEAAQ